VTENTARNIDLLLLTSCVSLDDEVEGGQAKVLTAIDMGASINIKDPTSDKTALMASMIRGKTSIVRILLSLNVEISFSDDNGYILSHDVGVLG